MIWNLSHGSGNPLVKIHAANTGTLVAVVAFGNNFKLRLLTGVCPIVKLEAGNVLFKAITTAKQPHWQWLRRAIRIGSRLGEFNLHHITMKAPRSSMRGASAAFTTQPGDFICRSRRHEWRDAMREIDPSHCLSTSHSNNSGTRSSWTFPA